MKTVNLQLHEVTKVLKSKVVESPDEYITRSKELKKILDGRMEERQNLKECVDQKKNQILKNEAAEVEVRSHQDKIFHLKEIMKKIELVCKLVSNFVNSLKLNFTSK